METTRKVKSRKVCFCFLFMQQDMTSGIIKVIDLMMLFIKETMQNKVQAVHTVTIPASVMFVSQF